MENASKALLIAAGVLIVILIIVISMRIFNSTGDIAGDAEMIGESIAGTTSDASKEAIYELKDLNGKSLIRVEEHEADSKQNNYYSSYFPQNPKILLKPNTKYMLSFDYKVNYATQNVGCGIGCGESYYQLDIEYNKIYYRKNSNEKEGSFKHTFTTSGGILYEITEDGKFKNKNTGTIVNTPYLHIRFSRMGRPGDCSVDISNVRFKEVK